VNVIGCVPDQVPVPVDNVCPCAAVPKITGAVTGEGATTETWPATTAVGAEDTFPVPAEFVAVTSVRIVNPTSAVPNRYDEPVAPVFAQPPPVELHRHHWVA
jgi:hypothetical protein